MPSTIDQYKGDAETLPVSGPPALTNRIPTEAERKANESINKARAIEVQKLCDKVHEKIVRINSLEQILNKQFGELTRLRKNLYGILGAKEPESMASLYEEQDRKKLQSIMRRYGSLSADDLITLEQLRDVRAAYGIEGEIEFDEDALVSADQDLLGGFWIQGWLWWMPKSA